MEYAKILSAGTITPEVINAAGNAQWESVGLAAVLLVGITAIIGGLIKVIKVLQFNKIDTDARIESAVYRANGIPIALLDSLPVPAWYKDRMGVMRYINQAYMAKFNVRGVDYLGKTDHEVWPKHIADKFVANDNDVLARNVVVTTLEEVPLDASNPKSPTEMFYVQKSPYRHPYDEPYPKGTIGFLLDAKHIERIVDQIPGEWRDSHDDLIGVTGGMA